MSEIFRMDSAGAVDHVHYARFATITPGSPGRCVECDAFGYIDMADLARNFQAQRCRECGYRWAYQFDEQGRLVEVTELTPHGAGAGSGSEEPRRRLIDLTQEKRQPLLPRLHR